jgi:TonB family protein
MNTYLNYLIEANLGLLVLYGLYLILLKNENQFSFKRIYLLGSLVSSLVFPLINIPNQEVQLIPSLSNFSSTLFLPEITVFANAPVTEAAPTSISVWQWIVYIYLTGIALFSVLLIVRVTSLVTLFLSSKKFKWKKYTVAELENGHGSFSFFNLIFLGKSTELSEKEKTEVLTHEEVHAQKLHSLDIVLVNVVGIVFWFNPVLLFYRNSLVQVHEFEADARSVEGRDVDMYCSLLAKVALQSNGYTLANHFTNSFTLKRIAMMKTIRKKIQQWKVASASITVLLFFFVVACQDQIVTELSESTISQVSEYPAEVKISIAELEKKYPGTKFTYVEGSEDEVRKVFMDHPDQKHMIMNSFDFPDRKMTGVLTVDISKYNLKDANDVYTIVEEIASPANEFKVFYEELSMQIKYPEQARKMGVEGKVFIEFVVNADGSLSDFVVLKGIGAGCDAEAIRVISQSKNWNPGKQRGQAVKQRMVLPVIFALGKVPDYGSISFEEPVEGAKQTMKVSGNLIHENGQTFVSGNVLDENGNPIPGMNIVLEGSTLGTVTNSDGKYKLVVNANGGKIIFSFVGFHNESLTF